MDKATSASLSSWSSPTASGPTPRATPRLAPPAQDPSITAGELFNQEIPTYVVAIGEAQGKAFADKLAMAGGTTEAIDAVQPAGPRRRPQGSHRQDQDDVVAPVCTPGLPRIMVLLDASSSMLNVNGGNKHAPAGMGGWDQARSALAGDMLDLRPRPHEQQQGGGPRPPRHLRVRPQRARRRRSSSSSTAPAARTTSPGPSTPRPPASSGCDDPYGGPPIKWTFKDGSVEDPPNFDEKTLSHMPKCDLSGQPPWPASAPAPSRTSAST
jgi:hypothetical protein